MAKIDDTWFVSGHRDVTEEEFKDFYEPMLKWAVVNKKHIVVGDYYGVDEMAQEYLKGYESVTVYHMLEAPRVNKGFETKGGFTSDEQRDAAMTKASIADIAWVRDGKESSGTMQNLIRRFVLRLGQEIDDAQSIDGLKVGRKFTKMLNRIKNNIDKEWRETTKERVQ